MTLVKKYVYLVNNKKKELDFAKAFKKEAELNKFSYKEIKSTDCSLFYSRLENVTKIFHNAQILPLKNSHWFIRTTQPSDFATALLCIFLERNNIPFTDKNLNTVHGIRTSKLSQTFQLTANNCACPSTWVIPIGQFSNCENIIIKTLNFPIIVKARGGLGERVWKCTNKTALRRKVKELEDEKKDDLILFQENINNKGDIRIVIFQNKVIASIGRFSTTGFLNNVSQGGIAEAITITKDEKSLAIKAAKTVGLELAGVDIVRTTSGPLIFEVNKAPDITSFNKAAGFDIAANISKSYFESLT